MRRRGLRLLSGATVVACGTALAAGPPGDTARPGTGTAAEGIARPGKRLAHGQGPAIVTTAAPTEAAFTRVARTESAGERCTGYPESLLRQVRAASTARLGHAPSPGHRSSFSPRPPSPINRSSLFPRPPSPINRSHPPLGPGVVVKMLADFDAALRRRFGVVSEQELESRGRLAGRVRVPVHVHVLSSGDEGRLSRIGVNQQITALNNAYGGAHGGTDTGVVFRLASFDVTRNTAWFKHPHRYERTIKLKLRRGGAGALNLYTASVGVDVLGFSTFPQWLAGRPRMDGVVIDYRSVPGGEFRHFNRGYTAVHEIGHWLGLFHTFENGCTNPGDAVGDTPYEGMPTEGCPLIKDTCKTPGSDPVHNFMDYGYDDCMREFTPGQGRRIRSMWGAYRS